MYFIVLSCAFEMVELSQTWWHVPGFAALKRLRLVNCESESNLDYNVRLS